MITNSSNKGYVALVSTLVVALSLTIFIAVVAASSFAYADSVTRKEYRTQARLNVHSCIDAGMLMLARNVFLSGSVSLSEFACTLTIAHDLSGTVRAYATSTMVSVHASASALFTMTEASVTLTEKRDL